MIYTWQVTWAERDRSGTGVQRFRSEAAARDYAARELASAVDVDIRPIDRVCEQCGSPRSSNRHQSAEGHAFA